MTDIPIIRVSFHKPMSNNGLQNAPSRVALFRLVKCHYVTHYGNANYVTMLKCAD